MFAGEGIGGDENPQELDLAIMFAAPVNAMNRIGLSNDGANRKNRPVLRKDERRVP